MGFWNKTDYNQTEFRKVQQAAVLGLGPFMQVINSSQSARRGFWHYLLDKDDFMQWPFSCQKALVSEAWYDGFLTLHQHPQAMVITLAATSLSLFALSFVTGASLSLFTCVLVTGLICAASHYMDNSQTEEPSMRGEVGEGLLI